METYMNYMKFYKVWIELSYMLMLIPEDMAY